MILESKYIQLQAIDGGQISAYAEASAHSADPLASAGPLVGSICDRTLLPRPWISTSV